MQKIYMRNLFLKYPDNLFYVRDLLGGILLLLMLNPKFSFFNQAIFAGLFLIWGILVIVYDRDFLWKQLTSKIFLFLCIFPLISIIYWLTGTALLNKHTLMIPLIYIFSCYYFRKEMRKMLKIYCVLAGAYIFMICIVTFYKLQVDPGLTRLLARGDKSVIADVITPFTATYATVYSVMLISVLLFGVALQTDVKKLKYLCVSLNVFSILFLFKAAYSISLILLFIGYFVLIFLKLWSRLKNKKKASCILVVSLVILFIVYLLTRNLIADGILSLMKFTSDEMQQRRVREIAELIRNIGWESEGGMLNRFKLYYLSFDTFLAHPFIGVGFRDELLHTTTGVVNPLIGGHSTILDMLASYGIFGITYILMIPISYYDIWKRKFLKTNDILFVVFVIFIFLSFINTSQNIMFYITMFFLIPGILMVIENEKFHKGERK